MKKLLLFVSCISYCMLSCDKEDKVIVEKEIKFSISVPTTESITGGRTTALPEPTTLRVTIKDEEGTTVANRKELTLYKFGETFLSLPLTLETSEGANYKLTEFFVLGADNQVAYVTPIEGSELAHLVADALEIEFAVSKDQITTVTPEVLFLSENANPQNYGYSQFGFNVVETISAVFSSFITVGSNVELTNSHLKIEGLRDISYQDETALWTYQTNLEAKSNLVTLKKASRYRVTASKTGYEAWNKTMSLADVQNVQIKFETNHSSLLVTSIDFVDSPARAGGLVKIHGANFGSYQDIEQILIEGLPMDIIGIHDGQEVILAKIPNALDRENATYPMPCQVTIFKKHHPPYHVPFLIFLQAPQGLE